MAYQVYLKKNEDKRIRRGHSWVYANEVLKIEGNGKNGDLAEVYDSEGRFIGKGYINHLSKILVRVFIRTPQETDDEEFYIKRFSEAKKYRETIGCGDAYRAVFAESDNLPAIIVDKYGDLLCIQLLSLGVDKNKEKIINALVKVFNPRGIYERSDAGVRQKEGLSLFKGKIYGEFEPRTIIYENGLKMWVDLENGQKTGYFLDQQANRHAIRRYVKDKTLLDCFCNVGGFSLNGAMGGAKAVTSLDISEKALSDVRENAKLNGLSDKITTVCGDVFEVLRNYRKEGKTFDTIVLDPPAFCKSLNDVKNAYKGYKDINILGMKLTAPGGFLITCSCSHYMPFTLFEKMLSEASSESGRTVRISEIKTQGADHPALLCADETSYLKFYILNVI